MKTTFWAGLLTVIGATPVWAAGREDTSGILVWAFLGFCALIVAAQAIPALLMMVGALRSAARRTKESYESSVESEAGAR